MTDLLAYLQTRRSVVNTLLAAPGPDPATLADMLVLAARAPDHGKLAPWRFVIYPQTARVEAARWLTDRARALGEDVEKRVKKAEGFVASPVCVGVISTAAPHPKIPEWEQELSAGAVCQTLLNAAAAYGYRAQWLTEWFTFDAEAAAYLGVGEGERVAGFIHIGSYANPVPDRDRPDAPAITSTWAPGC